MRPKIQPSRAIALLAAVTIALIALSVALLLWEMRKRDVERARLDTASLAHMFREQTERTFETADLVLRGVQERMQTPYGSDLPLDSPSVRLLLGARISAAPHLSLLRLTDDEGRIANSSQPETRDAETVGDSWYFKLLAAGNSDSLYVDRPRRGSDGDWSIDLARAFTDRSGKFRGVAIVTMDLPRFDTFYSWLKQDYPRPLALYMADGALVASVPPREDLIGKPAPELARLKLDLHDTQVRMVTHVGSDGHRNVMGLARMGHFPLLVSVASDEEQALASWRERAVSIALGALLVCGFIAVSAGLLSGELAREARLAQALRDAHERYHRTVDSLMDAIVAVDDTQRVLLFNPAAERMFGITAAQALGMPLEQVVPGGFAGIDGSGGLTGLRADGTRFPIEGTVAETLVDGKPQVTGVLRDVTERRRAEEELREMNRQLRALSASLHNVREEERTRIASELHDELGQQLTGLKLELSWLGARMKEGRAAGAQELDAVRHQLDTAITSVRRIATELRPRVLDDRAFAEALEWQTGEFARRSGLEVELDLPAADWVDDDATATALFRIVQESLTNVARHAGASTVRISLTEYENELVLRVCDDGCGFTPVARPSRGLGLVGMRERATALGGKLTISGAPGEGTVVEVRLPLAEVHLLEETE